MCIEQFVYENICNNYALTENVCTIFSFVPFLICTGTAVCTYYIYIPMNIEGKPC